MEKILLPETFTGTVENVVNKDGLVKGIVDSTIEYKAFLKDVRERDSNFDENEFLKFSYHRQKRDKKKEQQLYQMLLLYDEVLFTSFDFELNYDYSELKKIGGLIYLSNEQVDNLAYEDKSREIDFDFSQYIKPAVIHNLKNRIKPFYKIKDKNISDYRFASILYDMVYAEHLQKDQFRKEFHQLNKVAKVNKEYYEFIAAVNHEGYIPVSGEFYTVLVETVRNCVEPVLRDFNLHNKHSIEILNPEYSIEKLGIKNSNITDICDTYGALRIECSKVLPELREFSSIWDVLDCKDKHYKDVKRLRSVIEELLYTLENDSREKMIEQAAISVNKAAAEFNKGKKLSKIDKWSIIIAAPAGVLEYLNSMPPIVSLPLSVFGVSSYLTQKQIRKKNNWIWVVR